MRCLTKWIGDENEKEMNKYLRIVSHYLTLCVNLARAKLYSINSTPKQVKKIVFFCFFFCSIPNDQ